MKKVAASSMVAAISLVITGAPVSASAADRTGSEPEVAIVAQLLPGPHHLAEVAAMGKRARPEPAGRYVVRVPASQAAAEVARLRSEPGVRYAEVSRPVHATGVGPDDPCYLVGCMPENDSGSIWKQPYLATIGAPAAWATSQGNGVRVAVVDTGVDPAHEDLGGKIRRQTHVICSTPNTPGCDPNPSDDNGHGTHVSGLVAADTANHVGIASLGWNVTLDEYKVLDSLGDGNTADVDTAIYDAVAAGDKVINMSLANYSCQEAAEANQANDCGPDPDEQAAVEYAIAHNVVVVAAAGNGVDPIPADDGPTYPASYPGVLAVAATNDAAQVQSFSQWGRAANIAAPGLNDLSTWYDPSMPGINNQYALDTGTSMAAPLVAAAAALMISHAPSLSAQQVTELLEANASPTHGGNPINGGLLDVSSALAAESRPAPRTYLGYDLAGADGSVYSFGSVGAFGGLTGQPLARPIVGTAMEPNGLGYWLVASDGGVFTFGTAGYHGSTGAIRLAQPVVGMAATPDGRGYWLVASDGGIFTFGDAHYYGSTGSLRLNHPIVGMAATPDGRGYWLVASDGGIFTFGDAHYYGSTGSRRLTKPVVGLAVSSDGNGYWLVASDGGIFTFGDAHYRGSAGNVALSKPIIGMAATPDSDGYWLVASDGGIFTYGDARFYGSAGSTALPAPVVSAAA